MTARQLHSRLISHGFRVGMAFAAIYLIWGSTYLAIRFAIDTIPPFFMGGVRFAAAGLVLYLWARFKGEGRPTLPDIKAAAIIGALMVVLGNGVVIWAEQYVPSGLAAVMVATGPFWLVMIDWWISGRKALPATTKIGLAVGFTGVVMLTMFGSGLAVDDARGMIILSAVLLTFATLAWASGSMYARKIDLKVSLTMLLGLQMLSGGFMLILAGALTGEWVDLDVSAVSPVSAGALLYLIVFGTLVGYSAYVWLMRVSEPAKVATHGYVNPIIAVFLGWGIAGEPLTAGMLVATVTILLGVALINARKFDLARAAWRRFSFPRLNTNPELAMIARTWQGVVPDHKADAYYDYLKATGLDAFEHTNGNRGYYVLRKSETNVTRFMILSLWDSMDAIKQFAGKDPDKARFFPEDDDYLIEKEMCAEHYEVLGPVK
jgi:drug/metabolite transporter (DMT)-like permease/heme-degrading monooxygenase HmoA